jgi:hypothetical protein
VEQANTPSGGYPALNIFILVNNLKIGSSRLLLGQFDEYREMFYCKDVFWHRTYNVGSVGDVTLEKIQHYIGQQMTKGEKRKNKSMPSACPPPSASLLVGGLRGQEFRKTSWMSTL